jgi:hypothetical protein
MSNFKVTVEKVHTVEDHPNADRLSLVRVLGHTCISAKLDDGSHRYKPGDLVVYVGENTIVPDYLLKDGFWDETKGHGILGGKNHNVVKPIKLRGMFSLGILFPVSVVREKKEREYKVDLNAYPEQTYQDYCNATRTPG